MGVIADDALCQTWWRQTRNLTLRFYDSPNVKAGQSFVTLLTEELHSARERCWNSEQPIVFIGTVLVQIQGVKNFKDIRVRILRRMHHCTDGLIGALVEDTCGTGNARGGRAWSISKRDRE